jgi:hypothetical protein
MEVFCNLDQGRNELDLGLDVIFVLLYEDFEFCLIIFTHQVYVVVLVEICVVLRQEGHT